MTNPVRASLTTALAGNPSGWPEELLPLFERAITVEYASLTRASAPITYPLTPYVGEDGLTLDVSTGLTYPAKAERARRNPKVALLYSDPLGSGLDGAPVALVQGLATVRDSDLQANTDRYVRLGMAKLPDTYKGQPRFLPSLRRLVLRPHLDTGDADADTVVAGGPSRRAPPGVDGPRGHQRAVFGPSPSRQTACTLGGAALRLARGGGAGPAGVTVP
jgi:hypothetical protein